jgi:hypothetical protein
MNYRLTVAPSGEHEHDWESSRFRERQRGVVAVESKTKSFDD